MRAARQRAPTGAALLNDEWISVVASGRREEAEAILEAWLDDELRRLSKRQLI